MGVFFKQEKKVHNKVLEIENISKSYDDLSVINKFNMTINSGDRIGIIGENGIGKTTLIKCLIEDNFADNGTIKWSDNCSVGYFAQNHGDDFKSNTTLMDWMAKYSHKEDDLETIRGTLGRLLFSQDDIHKPVNVLSGGEQRRMLFGKIILQRANVIILDEPTNHLDLETKKLSNMMYHFFCNLMMLLSH